MYDLPCVTSAETLDPGTNVLVAGPQLSANRELAFEILLDGAARGDGSIVVTTTDDAGTILEEFVTATPVSDPDVGVVDCVTKRRGVATTEDDPRVKFASSPLDMTGIGIKLSEFLTEFSEGRGLTENRVLLDSVSTLLDHSDLQTVFRFLHVLTGRVQSADALGLYVVDSTAHDQQTINTLAQLFDETLEIEDGEPTIRTAGLS